MTTSAPYAMKRTVDMSLEEAEARVRDTLAAEGFGVLTEIDIRATLRKKLDVEFMPYKILGACNPGFAHQALQAERDIGLLLPCNVVLYPDEDPGRTVVAVVDPVVQLAAAGRPDLAALAADVREGLARALESI